MPVPQFTITTDVLDLTAKDIGLVTDEASYTRAWSLLKDSTEVATGSDAEFTHTLLADGVYTLSLTITELTETATVSMKLVTSTDSILPYQSIASVVSSLLPGYTIDWNIVQNLKIKWQGILCTPLEIPEGECFNELAYSQLANSLIGYLIVRDIIVTSANTYMISVSSGSGSIKKIVTGPTEVERYSVKDAYEAIFGDPGAWDNFLSQLCSLAKALNIMFKDCGSDHVSVIQVAYLSDYSYQHKYIQGPPEFEQKP